MDNRMIISRDDVACLLLDLLRPLRKHFSEGCAQLKIGHNSAPYGESDVCMEAYARLLWGIGPLVTQSNESLPEKYRQEIDEWLSIIRRGLINGTDPKHSEYWGDLRDYDHKMVEMAAIANAILLAPHVFIDPLSVEEKKRVITWFKQINTKRIQTNNWIAFRILVNVMLYKLGSGVWNEQMDCDIRAFENNYEANGWYHDGHVGRKDYYIPFAMHFYGLQIAMYLHDAKPEYCQELKKRAEAFYPDFKYWFDSNGRSVPFGRSLTYRFAHSAAFSAMVLADVNVPLEEVKYLIFGNFRYWCQQPIFDSSGILTIGYRYPNLILSEMYNAPGSPYWALKTFLILALPQDHSFWHCEERMPHWDDQKLLESSNMIVVHEHKGRHALIYPTGLFAPNMGKVDAKYQKFVYSSEFGFSVSRGNTLIDGAFDSTLAASEAGDDFWRMRRQCQRFEANRYYTRSLYEIIPDVHIESLIIPLECGHIRVHYIKTKRDVELADGGFAIAKENGMYKIDDSMILQDFESICCNFPWGKSGAVSLSANGKAELIIPFPNTNLMNSLTVIPTIRYALNPGYHCITDYFYGMTDPEGALIDFEMRISDFEIYIKRGGENVVIDGPKWLSH